MKYIVKYAKLGGIFLGILIISAFIFSLFNLIGVSYQITMVFSIIIMVILFLIFGIIEGLNASKKGFIAGFKIGSLFLAILILINLVLFRAPFMISRLIYYAILMFSSVFGAMIGINRKKKE